MATTSRYQFERLDGADCGPNEVKCLTSLLRAISLSPDAQKIEVTSAGLVDSCNLHNVLVVRDNEHKQRLVVGALVFTIRDIFGQRHGIIDLPAVDPKHDEHDHISFKLFRGTVEFAREQEVVGIEAPHRVREVLWKHNHTLQKLGFTQPGCHFHHRSLV